MQNFGPIEFKKHCLHSQKEEDRYLAMAQESDSTIQVSAACITETSSCALEEDIEENSQKQSQKVSSTVLFEADERVLRRVNYDCKIYVLHEHPNLVPHPYTDLSTSVTAICEVAQRRTLRHIERILFL